jgi:hypothetical protein
LGELLDGLAQQRGEIVLPFAVGKTRGQQIEEQPSVPDRLDHRIGKA